VLALCINILLHSLIAHKEYRFIWLSTFLMLVLAAITGVGG
jgi:fatty-acid desaturase